MLCVIGYYRGDLDQAERLATRLAELGGLAGHSLLVARDKGTTARPFAGLGFDSIEEIEVIDAPMREWPFPANNVFQKCARHIYNHVVGSPRWLWLEPDVWPMCPGWLATIEGEDQEAIAAGKSFLGDFVSVHTPELNVPDHMSGVGVYPANLLEFDPGGDIMLCDRIAWDVSGAYIIMPRMHKSQVIHHSWKHKAFVDQEQVQREIFEFKPNCVLFHADKTGSLSKLLPVPVLAQTSRGDDKARESTKIAEDRTVKEHDTGLLRVETTADSRGGQNFSKGREEAKPTSAEPILPVAVETAPVHLSSGDFAGSNPAPCAHLDPAFGKDVTVVMRTDQEQFTAFQAGMELSPVCDILIKSYPQDYPLLEYCLKSLEKFASGFRQIIVIYPEGEPPNLWTNGDPRYKGVPVHENGAGDGYMFQQQVKANAHELTDARYICHFDSDCFITRPITPASFFQDGKPIWLMTPYSKIEAPWQASTEKFLGEPVEFEFMRRHPTFCPRSIHVAAAAFCLMKHGVTLKDYIMAQPVRDVSEFNLLGALAYSRARQDFTWIDTTIE